MQQHSVLINKSLKKYKEKSIKMTKRKTKKAKRQNQNQVQNKWYKNKVGIVLITLVCLAGLTLTLYLTGVLNMGSQTPKSYNSPIPMVIDVNKKYTATIKTVKGDIVCELYPQDAPVTVNSFVSLARKGYYNGCTFHRVIPGFMAQGGDPTGTGAGGPGYEFQNEISAAEAHYRSTFHGKSRAPIPTEASSLYATSRSRRWMENTAYSARLFRAWMS